MKTYIHWIIEEIERALDSEDTRLAKRYVSKLRENFFCVRCKEPIEPSQEDVKEYFKGYKHTYDCWNKKGK